MDENSESYEGRDAEGLHDTLTTRIVGKTTLDWSLSLTNTDSAHTAFIC